MLEPAVPAPPSEVREAWLRVVRGWDRPHHHDTFVGLAARHRCFAWATARYRGRPIDAIAYHQLERLRRAAVAVMLAGATARRERRPTLYRWALIACVCVMFFTLVGRVFGTAVQAHADHEVRQAQHARS